MPRRNVDRKKTHSVEEEREGAPAKQPGTHSVIPISRYHAANLSLEIPTILDRHHICMIPTHTINSLPAS